MSSDLNSRSWFVVLPNPKDNSEILNTLTEREMCEEIVYRWNETNPDTRSAACLYCKSAKGLEHLHIALENKNGTSFKTLQNWFQNLFACAPHIEPTKGNKSQVEDYINKRGKFEEKGEIILEKFQQGELIGGQGRRTDLIFLADEIANGKTPSQILAESPEAYKFKNHLNDMFYTKRRNEIGICRNVSFNWECGPSGSGKSYLYIELCEKYGKENVYYTNCESGHLFDNYNGEPIVFLDEFRGGVLRWGQLLSLTDKYVTPVEARYSNKYSLWKYIFVSVVNPPDIAYSEMLFNKGLDNFTQLSRRLESVCYHYKDGDEYKEIRVSASDYMEQVKELLRTSKATYFNTDQQKSAFQSKDRKTLFRNCSQIARPF